MAYSTDDFLKAYNESGFSGAGFSQYDYDTAMKYPEFGLSIIDLKKQYQAATTPEQKILANEQANKLRQSYGNYSGGGDGSEYINIGKLPTQINSTLDSMYNYDPYNNQYAAKQQDLLSSILNRPDFSYTKENDPQWGSYKKSYLREGERATSNALAQTSAASGGRPSTYAVGAATQAGDYYATKLNDVLPQLYQQAYDRYLKEYQMKHNDLGMVNSMEQTDYNRYNDDYNRLGSTLGAMQGQDATDYSRYLDSYNIRTDENRYQDQMQQQALNNAMQMSQLYGYVTQELSQLSGLPAGTPTADQKYQDWYMQHQTQGQQFNQQQALSAAKSGGSGGTGGSGAGAGGGGTQGVLDAMLGFDNEWQAYQYAQQQGVGVTMLNQLMDYWRSEKENSRFASLPADTRTRLDDRAQQIVSAAWATDYAAVDDYLNRQAQNIIARDGEKGLEYLREQAKAAFEKKQGGAGPAPAQTPAQAGSTSTDFVSRFNSGERTPEIRAGLLAMGYTEQQINDVW